MAREGIEQFFELQKFWCPDCREWHEASVLGGAIEHRADPATTPAPAPEVPKRSSVRAGRSGGCVINLNSISEPSLHIQERASKMWATKYDAGDHTVIYKVVPWGRKFEHKTKDRRLVVFDMKRGIAECLSLETGEVCEANSFHRLCSHVYRAYCVMNQGNRRAA